MKTIRFPKVDDAKFHNVKFWKGKSQRMYGDVHLALKPQVIAGFRINGNVILKVPQGAYTLTDGEASVSGYHLNKLLRFLFLQNIRGEKMLPNENLQCI